MRIAFLGDSLTEGWPGAAYLPLLERLRPSDVLLNCGRAGDTVNDLLLRMRRVGLEQVDLTFVWVGANDAVLGAWDDSAQGSGWSWGERLSRVRGDYDELLEWTVARAQLVMCVEPIILDAQGSLWEKHSAEVAGVVASLAEQRERCQSLDLHPAFAAARERGEGAFTTDGVHFTDTGAMVVAATFAAAIEGSERSGAVALHEGG
jgi:lysophospholipase L1-like esterase